MHSEDAQCNFEDGSYYYLFDMHRLSFFQGAFFFLNLLLCEDIFLGYCHLDMRNLCIISDDTAPSLQTCKEVLAILGEFLYLHLSSKINVLTNQNM